MFCFQAEFYFSISDKRAFSVPIIQISTLGSMAKTKRDFKFLQALYLEDKELSFKKENYEALTLYDMTRHFIKECLYDQHICDMTSWAVRVCGYLL